MQTDDLGQITHTFRTSRIQAVILFIVGALVAGFAVLLWATDDSHNLLPATLIAAGGAAFLFGWGARLALPVLQIRQRGVSLRFIFQRVAIGFDQIESLGLHQRTVDASLLGGGSMTGSYSGIWFKRRDGSTLNFPLESNVMQACTEIQNQMNASAGGTDPASQVR